MTSLWGGIKHYMEADERRRNETLADFTTSVRVIPLSVMAIVIGLIGTVVAWLLLRLIGLFTNIFYFQHWGFSFISPASNRMGYWAILVPVVGGLIVGLMARYGSERIRGHGIPEALESILINGSRVEPPLAILKPVSSAISIGSGGPFGAEGPIIMTGGAVGSLIAQFFQLSSAERKTLLVAGAAAGMSATFASPLAAVLLSAELLLFEWKPRSLVPVALASATAGAARRYILGPGPLFPVPAHPLFIGPDGLIGCAIVGILAGVLSTLLTAAVYAAEDSFIHVFKKLHWMWWPAIGGVVVGVGGMIFPQALGVGYDTIGKILQGNVPVHVIAGVLIVKSIIWAVSLGSGTSGGVLAPLLMMGGALGGLETMFLPFEGAGFWQLISMGATLGGTMRSPLTGVIFCFELTHDPSILLPLLVASIIGHCFTVLVLKRSILTEKVARRGYHLSREYSVDPLEILFVREVMRHNLAAFPAAQLLEEVRRTFHNSPAPRGQHLYPIVDGSQRLVGVITRKKLRKVVEDPAEFAGSLQLGDVARGNAIVAYPDEPLRAAVNRMAESGFTRFPVVERGDERKLVGMISLEDLLRARTHNLDEERTRERVLRIRLPFSRNGRRRAASVRGPSKPAAPEPKPEPRESTIEDPF
ncbi:MAG TPA: chloride channel protein [Bryobacteraceae bacterium]|nr:chloride channel protein [Bryobacteraceae bacterium]